MSRAALDQLVCLGYLVALVGVGLWRGRKVDTQDEFVVGGRRMSTFVLIGTLLATWIGTGSVLGGAGLAYRVGFSALWFSAGAWSAIVILYLIAGRARAFAQYTVPDMLEARYGPAARILGTLVTIVDGRPTVSHLPFLPDREAQVLHCHVARANMHWRELERSPEALVIS